MTDYPKNKRYRKRWFMASFLFFISIWMLVVPVMPHHHHSNGMICMKNDVEANCCTPSNHAESHHHCCCNTDCVTMHFLQSAPHSTDFSLQADYSWIATLYTNESLFRLLLLPESYTDKQSSGYLESLHGIFITEAKGLRAPPSFMVA